MKSERNSIYPTNFTRNVRDYYDCRTCYLIGPVPHQSKIGLAASLYNWDLRCLHKYLCLYWRMNSYHYPWLTALPHMDVKMTLKKPGADLAEFTPCYFIYGGFFFFQKVPGLLVYRRKKEREIEHFPLAFSMCMVSWIWRDVLYINVRTGGSHQCLHDCTEKGDQVFLVFLHHRPEITYVRLK